MDKHLAKKLNIVLYSDSWPFFEQYLKQELDRAYIKFDSTTELAGFAAIQAEIKILKKFINLRETTRLSFDN